MHDVQDQIFVSKMLFGLVVTQPSRVGDSAAESVQAIAHQGVTVDR
jgi:hypothetical protein